MSLRTEDSISNHNRSLGVMETKLLIEYYKLNKAYDVNECIGKAWKIGQSIKTKNVSDKQKVPINLFNEKAVSFMNRFLENEKTKLAKNFNQKRLLR